LLSPAAWGLPWDVLTAQGSLDALGVVPGGQGRLLIRGGTSSVGMAAASIASGYGAETAATTRRQGKACALAAAGADHVLLDDGGSLAPSVHAIWPEGPDYVLDLVGASTAVESLHLVRRGGTVCVSGSLSGWVIPDFQPVAMIPSGTTLTAFHSDDLNGSAGATVLPRIVHEVAAGVYRPNVDRVVSLDDIVAAHRYMEANQATGKLAAVP
jgi:NADPH:quinone reductase-like Zn-dependent oxidoreductase